MRMQLSAGGALEVCPPRDCGTATVFDSAVVHAVSELTNGVRYCLIAHSGGDDAGHDDAATTA